MADTKETGFGLNKKTKKDTVYTHTFTGLIPGDAAIAVEKVLEKMGLKFHETVTLKKGYGGVTEIPFSRYRTPDGDIPIGTYVVEGFGEITVDFDGYGAYRIPAIQLNAYLASANKKELWNTFLDAVEEYAKEHSIFKGRALIVEGAQDLLVPRRLNLDKPVELFMNAHVMKQIEETIYWPLQNRDLCIKNNIRTRRGALLEGYYGTGKSIALYIAAQKANAAGMSVLNVNAGAIGIGVELGSMVAPVLLVVEDLDAGAHGDRDALNGLINKLSSISSKTKEDYMIAASTNFIERIDPALLRPERIDSIIHVELPNRETAGAVLGYAAGNTAKINDAVSDAITGITPAVICEIGERAKINAIRSGRKTTSKELLEYVEVMKHQINLAKPELRQDSLGDQLARNLSEVIRNGAGGL